MPDLLLELFSEEIPARMQARAAEDLRKAVTDRLVEAGLPYDGAKAFVTPRRLTLAVQGVENVYDLNFNGRAGAERVTYGDVFLQAEQEYSRHNFEYADTDMLFEQFRMAESACKKYLEAGWSADADGDNRGRHLMALPAYDQCIKASHIFNLLDARGVISVTERQSYILRVRELAKACGEAWLATEGGGKTK